MKFNSAKKFILDKLEKELPSDLTYHSIQHTMGVYHDAMFLAESEGVKGNDLTLLLTAALYHDSGFILTYQNHEQAGCSIARTFLPQFEYNPSQIEHICEMILATKIPQTPKDHLGQILCDADLFYLGGDQFYDIGNELFEEFKQREIVNSEQEWNKLQLRFLQNHEYFTMTARNRRAHQKTIYLNEIEKVVSGYAA